jgi:hypothetical protein
MNSPAPSIVEATTFRTKHSRADAYTQTYHTKNISALLYARKWEKTRYEFSISPAPSIVEATTFRTKHSRADAYTQTYHTTNMWLLSSALFPFFSSFNPYRFHEVDFKS